MTKKIITFILISMLGLLSSIITAAEPTISASLESNTIALNETTRFTVSIKNVKGRANPELPDVEGLTFSSVGQSSNISIINGNVTSVINYSYQVIANKEGEYEIPSVLVNSNGKNIRSNPLKLKVTAPRKNAAQPQLQNSGGLSDEITKQTAFITIDRADNKGREHLYVGESTPVKISAYFRPDLRVSNINTPSLSSDAFTLSSLSDNPEQNIEVIEGVRYRVVTWYGNLSGIKGGDYDLTTEIKATIGMPTKRRSNRGRSNDPFDDPFFDSFFTTYQNQEVELKSETKKTKVITPPVEGRPDSFTGAVGQYIIKADPLPDSLETGEATSLKVYIEGEGNFDRVNKPTLMPEKAWKTYKEKTQLELGDIVAFHARKHFEIPAVVTQPGELETFFEFSYFDPETEEYKTVQTEKHKINVIGKSISMTDPVASNDEAIGNLPAMKASLGSLFFSDQEMYEKTWYRTLITLLLFIILGCFVFQLFLQNADSESIARRKLNKENERLLSDLENNVGNGTVLTFFQQCRQVLQNQIAVEIGGKAEAITISDVQREFPFNQAAIEIFKKADEVEYSTQEERVESMNEWLEKMRTALAEIKMPSNVDQVQQPSSWGEVSSKRS